ncbi:MAG TPA: alpha/beta hydrolase [Longimicrobium sp.]|jgi:pimeloyl-ACP methyl ester carboxylesterase|nr:alpha/beta hydrolase [Longimicrobium sp.]
MISHRSLAGWLAAALAAGSVAATAQQPSADRPTLEMRPCELPNGGGPARCGTYHALENREQPGGRRIPVDVVVLPARSATPRPDPIFFIAGGPGQTVTEIAAAFASSPHRQERDFVLVDQRGTSPAHALDCQLPGSPQAPQRYLEPVYQPALFRQCRAELEAKADLTRYLTADYVEDLDEVRRALGYGPINVQGGSYGTRVVLHYLRLYPQNARTAVMSSVSPPAARNPLTHARDSQLALDSIFALCDRDTACRGAFPELRREFAETLERLRRQPARVTITNPATLEPTEITLDRDAFAEGVRLTLYNWDRARRLPLLLHRAYGGDYTAFAQLALGSAASVRGSLRFGLLMSVVCAEDVPRITEADIVQETRGTFLGDVRVRTQSAACAEWPRRALPAGYNDPIVSDVPALLVSGAYDPATGPRWGQVAARTLRNSVHVVIPGSHTAGSPCVDRMVADLLERGSVQGLDTSCVAGVTLPPFIVSDDASAGNE